MQLFNILDPQTNLRESRFLEASAGTGKTYSIENLYARLLMENSDLKSENILVVTFTKAAALDLKNRIKNCLSQSLKSLSIKPTIEELKATLLLEEAIYNFDQAAIFTIHGFCFKTLQENSFEARIACQSDESTLSKEELIDISRSYLTTELNPSFISQGQLEILLKNFQGKASKLQESLLQAILKGQEILATSTYEQAFNRFCSFFKAHSFSKEKLLDDFVRLSPGFLGICDRSGNIKKENLEKMARFAELFDKKEILHKHFDKELQEGIYVFHAFHEKNKKAKAKVPKLHYPEFYKTLEKELWPIVQEAGDPLAIFANLASGCQKKLYSYLEENNKLEFSYLLKKMYREIGNTPALKEIIRSQYKVAIIDEFQDTDPLQWEIFYQLFFEGNSQTIVYLVGDPKQSIYSFRSADIYTYLAAEEAMSKGSKASLLTNYRSQPSLIRALNTLFSEETTPGWIDLPSRNKYLPYQPVLSAEKNSDRLFKDTIGSVHFCLAKAEKSESLEKIEERIFFPFFIQEIRRLHILENISFQDIAILVHDRFQAKRLMKKLDQAGLPNILQKSSSLVQSLILPALHELLIGLLNPKQESLFKAALGGRIIGLDCSDMLLLNDSLEMVKAVEQALMLRDVWQKKGIGQFFQELLSSSWGNKKSSVRNHLLSFEGGAKILDELMSLVGLLIEYEFNSYSTADKIISYLEELIVVKDTENEEMKLQQDATQDAINILTIHASKGLEYGIVFALGLCNRSPAKETLIQNRKTLSASLSFFPTGSEEHSLHIKECDAEKMRQLYVAMTRAKYRLYVPCISGWKAPKLGTASPLELFLARHRQPPCDYDELYKRLQGDVTKNIEANLEITISECQEGDFISESIPNVAVHLIPPKVVKIPGKPFFCTSFSSLAQSVSLNIQESAPNDFDCIQKTLHTLPAGRETGLLFHEILQKIPFDIQESDLVQFVQPFLRNTAYYSWQDTFVAALENVLQCPFLKNLPKTACFREMEFLFPNQLGLMTGIVDMVFIREEKYYLLDWKTNWLGANTQAYSFESMHKSMVANQYHLQAKIYAQALKQYVKLFDIRPFQQSFGGAYYIFLRGLQSGTECGIYHFFPEIQDE